VSDENNAPGDLEKAAKAIIRGEWEEGGIATPKEIAKKVGCDEKSAKDIQDRLVRKRMLRPQPGRTGTTVNKRRCWDYLDREVVEWMHRWDYSGAIRFMTEVRQAIEPVAAHHAAQRIRPQQGPLLTDTAKRLFELGHVETEEDFHSNRQEFGKSDESFHTLILECSGNDAFAAYAEAVAVALDYRLNKLPSQHQLSSIGTTGNFPPKPRPISLVLHVGLAQAVVEQKPDEAEAMARGIIAEFSGELNTSGPLAIEKRIGRAVRQIFWPEWIRSHLNEVLSSLPNVESR
jgi:DNA-binding FadR family transcriptional regulator